MKSEVLINSLSEELGIYVDPTRLSKYEARGITRSPRKVGKYKDYNDSDYDKIKKVIVLSEMGINLDDVRKYLMGVQVVELDDVFKDRIRKLGRILEVAKSVWQVQ